MAYATAFPPRSADLGTPHLALSHLAATAAGRVPGVASVADAPAGEGDVPGHCGVVVAAGDGHLVDLRVFVRAYLADFLELGWAVRRAIRDAAEQAGLGRRIGLIDVQVVGLVLPVEQAAVVGGCRS